MPIDALSVFYAQLTRDLLAIAKFLYITIIIRFLPHDAVHSADCTPCPHKKVPLIFFAVTFTNIDGFS